MDIVVATDAEHAAGLAAAIIADALRAATDARGSATAAVSGGSTAPPMLAALATAEIVDWSRVGVWQVDERYAADDSPDRNLTELCAALGSVAGTIHPMPVGDPDRRHAAADYAGGLPERFDVVHLGIGSDGHTASWPPESSGAEVADPRAPVSIAEGFAGFDRMTIGPSVVAAARMRVVLAVGAGKASVIRRWIDDGDTTLPISSVSRDATIVVLDAPAAAELAESSPADDDYGRDR